MEKDKLRSLHLKLDIEYARFSRKDSRRCRGRWYVLVLPCHCNVCSSNSCDMCSWFRLLGQKTS